MKRRAEKVKVIGGQMNGSSSWNRRQKKHDGGVRKIEKGVKEEQELPMGRRGLDSGGQAENMIKRWLGRGENNAKDPTDPRIEC